MAAERSGLVVLARLGYAARGAVSLMVGGLALLAAFGRGGGATGSKGALVALPDHLWGQILLGAIALGLFGFALWRLLQSLLDADGLGRDWKALGKRAGQLVSAAIYGGLGAFAVSLLLGQGSAGQEEQSARDWTAWLMAQPLGRWLVAAVGAGVLAGAAGSAAKAWTGSFRHELSCDGATAAWVVPLGRLGFAARAAVFLVVGAFLLIAAYHANPSEARGLGGALVALRDQPFGAALFAAVAAGLAAFGIFEFAEARYRRMVPPPEARKLDVALPRNMGPA